MVFAREPHPFRQQQLKAAFFTGSGEYALKNYESEQKCRGNDPWPGRVDDTEQRDDAIYKCVDYNPEKRTDGKPNTT
jgi:hypothetical protein